MKVVRFSAGLLVGAALSAGLVLLLVPRSGEETRRLVEAWAQGVLDDGRQAAEARRLELTAQFEALKRAE